MTTAPTPAPLEQLCEGVIEAGWLAALAVVPLFFNPHDGRIFEPDKSAVLRLLVLVMCVAWSIKVAGGGRAAVAPAEGDFRRPKRIPLLFPSLLVLISTALSVAWSVDPRISIAGSYVRAQGLWSSLALVAFFALVLTHLRSARQWRRVLYAVTLTSFGVACYAVLQSLRIDPMRWDPGTGTRVGSTLGNALFLAGFLGLTFFPIVGELSNRVAAGARRSAGEAGFGSQLPTRSLVGYTLALQTVALVISRSRGPLLGVLTGSLLGLLAILLVARARFPAAPRLRWRALRRWSWLMLIGLAVVVLAALWAGSRPGEMPGWLHDRGRSRLAAPLDTRSSSVQTRLLTWQGGVDLLREGSAITGLSPLQRAARGLLGYGPETFPLVYARHDTAERSRAEGGDGLPDRAHNEVLDRLVETGVLGFSSWFLWFGTLFFLGSTALFPRRRSPARLYWPLLGCGALLGAALPALLGAPRLAFFGVALGMLAGVAVFLVLLSRDRAGDQDSAVPWSATTTLIVALLAVAAAHLVDINLGIAVTATKLYLWFFAAVLVAAHQRWLVLEPTAEHGGEGFARDGDLGGGWIAGLIVATLVFPLLRNRDQAATSLTLLADNLAHRRGPTPVGGSLWLPIVVWLAAVTTAVPIDRLGLAPGWKSAARFAATSLGVGGVLLLYQAHRLSRTVALEHAGSRSAALDTIAGHAASFQIFVLLWVLVAGVLLGRRRAIPQRRGDAGAFCRRPLRALAAAALLAAAAVPVIAATWRPLAADALLKQGTSRLDAGDGSSALPILRRAAALAPREPTYRRELARALAVVAQSASAGPEREAALSEARSSLELARSMSPLDPESTASLGSLFAIEASLAVDEEARRTSLARAAEELQYALELRPQWVTRIADLAMVEYRRGNRVRAFELTDRALALDSTNRNVHRALADIHTVEAAVSEAAGDRQAASDHRARAAAATERADSRSRRR